MRVSLAAEAKPTGETLLWALPEAVISGQGVDEDEAVRDLYLAFAWYEGWLNRTGRHAQVPEAFDIVEYVSATGYPETGDTEALLSVDRVGLSDEDAERFRAELTESRSAIVQVCEELMRSGLDEAGEKKLRWTLAHLAQSEWWYASRIPGSLACRIRLEPSLDPFAALESARRMFLEDFLPFAIGRADRERIYPVEGESWTVRKALRRALWHDLYHLRRLEEMLTAA